MGRALAAAAGVVLVSARACRALGGTGRDIPSQVGGLLVSERIQVPNSWPARTALPPDAQVHLLIEATDPVRGEIFVLSGGQQYPVLVLHAAP